MLKKIIPILIISMMMFALPLEAKTLKGGVKYTVKQAREEAFANVEYSLPQSIIKANLTDPNYKENKKAIKLGVTELNDRYIGYFSDGSYAIVYKNNLYHEFYYNNKGKLESIGKRSGLVYPVKCYKYDLKGELIIIVLYVSDKLSYTFLPSGTLESYWIDNIGYDVNGNIIGKMH